MSGLRADETLRGDRIDMDASFSRVAVSLSNFVTTPKILIILFLCSLPLVNPWVRGDGVGYYAYLRSILIDHDLHFEDDYLAANRSFVIAKTDGQDHILPTLYTKTGYVENHFAVGPAILWAPAVVIIHGIVLLADKWGAHVAADGYSRPYLLAMAVTTACYGFLSLFLAYRIARKYFDDQSAFLATVGIWMASSLPIYMYFNPSWSHAISAFTVSLYLWYWERTKMERSAWQWAILGLLAGLMGNVYYPNAILLIFPALEIGYLLLHAERASGTVAVLIKNLAVQCGIFSVVFLASLLPTFITRKIIYGNPFETGYPPVWTWNWTSPVLLKVLFSSDHGMFSWTPILIFAVAGLPLLIKRDVLLGLGSIITFVSFYYFIASYPDWDGISSFGNRFFVSLTPIFILGLAALIASLADWLGKATRALALAGPALTLLIIWNMSFIFQWGTHMVPARGEISWSAMIHNQFGAVPQRLTQDLKIYFLNRGEMMKQIEQKDLEQQRLQQQNGE
ncbi:MAG TPA: glycosyltransferase family 39 protein [Candidatus Saccharimonadales bacterium]|jgi:hypothetical protein|nr:glycosyltransferase family 39 protein [Candidatus Saccharimonadales bacterium]